MKTLTKNKIIDVMKSDQDLVTLLDDIVKYNNNTNNNTVDGVFDDIFDTIIHSNYAKHLTFDYNTEEILDIVVESYGAYTESSSFEYINRVNFSIMLNIKTDIREYNLDFNWKNNRHTPTEDMPTLSWYDHIKNGIIKIFKK